MNLSVLYRIVGNHSHDRKSGTPQDSNSISDKQDNTRCSCRRSRYDTMYFRSSGKVRRRDRTLAEMEYFGSPDLLLSGNPLARYTPKVRIIHQNLYQP